MFPGEIMEYMPISFCLCLVLIFVQTASGIAEMFFWHKLGPSLARNRDPKDLDQKNLARAINWADFIAFNQGVYNLFLAAGLIMSLGMDMQVHKEFAMFFAACVGIAGVAGGYTGIKTVFVVQALPGFLLFGALYYGI